MRPSPLAPSTTRRPAFGLALAALLATACGADAERAPAALAQDAEPLTTAPVQLLRAVDSIVSGGGGALQQILVFDVAVKNLAYQKRVFVRLQDPCGSGSWSDYAGAFVQAASPDGYELWRVKYSINTWGGRGPFTFAVGYDVNGTTYWDSNAGKNYVLPFVTGSTNGMQSGVYGLVLANSTTVLAANGSVTNGWLSGTVHLANLGYQKSVSVVYSTDGWATRRTVAAAYVAGPNANGVETWSFSTPVGSATQAQFAVSYTVNGATAWDNNFTRNYTATAAGADGAATPTGDIPAPVFCPL